MRKEVGDMIKKAEAAGFTFDRYTGSGHFRMTHPSGGAIVIPSTPSGPRWKQNVAGDIRRVSRGEDCSNVG